MMFNMIGDSHTCSFNGFDDYLSKDRSMMKYFKTVPIIPIQASYIADEQDDLCKQFFNHVDRVPRDEWIIPVLGEIDTRTIIAQQVNDNTPSIETPVDATLELFEVGLMRLLQVNKNIALLSPFTIRQLNQDYRFCRASLCVIHQISACYDWKLKALANKYGLPHFSITDSILSYEFQESLTNYFDAWCHIRGEVVRELLKSQFESVFRIDITERK